MQQNAFQHCLSYTINKILLQSDSILTAWLPIKEPCTSFLQFSYVPALGTDCYLCISFFFWSGSQELEGKHFAILFCYLNTCHGVWHTEGNQEHLMNVWKELQETFRCKQ